MTKNKDNENIGFQKGITLLIISAIFIFIGIVIMGESTTIVLLINTAIISTLATIWGTKWEKIQDNIVENIKVMTVPILILMSVGLLVGSWMLSGTIPSLIYYGMKLLTPKMFLVMACIISSIMSVMTGTSWGTVATAGVALMGISTGLGIPLHFTAGAIITGALFGDKLSPLSDTTVMASAVSEVDIIEHIKHMLYTTIPCYIIGLVIYLILGFRYGSGAIEGEEYNVMISTLENVFHINPILIIPPVLVLILILLKKPTIPTFVAGIVSAMVLSIVVQDYTLSESINSLVNGFTYPTEIEIVDSMLLRGGLNEMMGTVALVMSAGIFGAPFRATGAIKIIMEKISNVIKNGKQMMLTVTLAHLISVPIIISYYITFTLIASLTKDLYDKYGLHRKNLSRTLEDTGTATAAIIPWGVSAAFYSSTLGVSVSEYALYAPITYLSTVFAIIYILTGFGIAKTNKLNNHEDNNINL